MANNRFTVTVTGASDVTTILNKLAGALKTRDILDESGAILFNRLRSRFIQETDPDGNKWKRSKAAIKRQLTGRGGGTLYDTGRLFQSLQLSAVDDETSTIGTDVPYAEVNNDSRRFLGFGEEDVTVAQRLVIRRIREALK